VHGKKSRKAVEDCKNQKSKISPCPVPLRTRNQSIDGCLTSLDHRRDPTDRSLFHLKVFMKQMKKGGRRGRRGTDQAEYMRGRQEGVVCDQGVSAAQLEQ
jgi:hypothetical protein